MIEVLKSSDPEVFELCRAEERRQADKIRLIPSENYVSKAVLAASSSVFTNKYSEGYPGKRYYEGQDFVDPLEQLTIDRAKALFGAAHANVQPYSGSPANLAVYLAFLKPGDKVMGLALPMGGHLTHGWNVSITGRYFTSVQYGVRKDTGRIDYDEVRDLAKKERPALLWAGGTAYSRLWDFETMASIAREVGARFCADIAHIAGLVAGGAHPSPVPHADVVTTTTHKTLRGPRGGMILCRTEHAQPIDRAVFPGLQGGPARAQHRGAGGRAARGGAAVLQGLREESGRKRADAGGGADRPRLRRRVGRHGQPPDPGRPDQQERVRQDRRQGAGQGRHRAELQLRPLRHPQAVRSVGDSPGSPAVSSRGMGEAEMKQIAAWMDRVVGPDEATAAAVAGEVREVTRKFPAPGISG